MRRALGDLAATPEMCYLQWYARANEYKAERVGCAWQRGLCAWLENWTNGDRHHVAVSAWRVKQWRLQQQGTESDGKATIESGKHHVAVGSP